MGDQPPTQWLYGAEGSLLLLLLLLTKFRGVNIYPHCLSLDEGNDRTVTAAVYGA